MRPPLAVLCLLCALAACAHKAPPRERLVAAVMPFSCAASEAEHAEEAKGLADALTVALVRSGRLRLVERDRVDALLSEARFDLSGAVDSARAAQIGKQLGAAAVVLGSITSVALREEASSGDFSGKSKRTVDVEIQARLVKHRGSGGLVAARRFRTEVAPSGADIEPVVAAFGEALSGIGADIVGWSLVEGEKSLSEPAEESAEK